MPGIAERQVWTSLGSITLSLMVLLLHRPGVTGSVIESDPPKPLIGCVKGPRCSSLSYFASHKMHHLLVTQGCFPINPVSLLLVPPSSQASKLKEILCRGSPPAKQGAGGNKIFSGSPDTQPFFVLQRQCQLGEGQKAGAEQLEKSCSLLWDGAAGWDQDSCSTRPVQTGV